MGKIHSDFYELCLDYKKMLEYLKTFQIEWHSTKNISPQKLKLTNQLYWWQCSKNNNHEWEEKIWNLYLKTITKVPICKFCEEYSLSLANNYPELTKEVHPTLNKDFDPRTTNKQSKINIWWQCSENSTHEWKASIYSRTEYKSKCPLCEKYSLSLENNYPELTKEVHPTLNKDFDPRTTNKKSKRNIWWRCSENSTHQWKASIYSRTKNKSKCPFCEKYSLSLANNYPELAKEIHPTLNKDFDPKITNKESQKIIWWQCTENSSHQWKESIKRRVEYQNKCPLCNEYYLSLAYNCPDLTKEIHPVLNKGIDPYKLKKYSNKKIWWQCLKFDKHVWKQTINRRILFGENCPYCEEYMLSVAYNYPDLVKEIHPTLNKDLNPKKLHKYTTRLIWWQCPKVKSHIWEASILNRKKNNKSCPFCK